jgi:SAM-dependent MidA family methyltransferase
MPTLPTPSPAALEHSHKLLALVHREIEAAGGYLSFARFMEIVLYTPGLGYYSAGNPKLGQAGDFVTAPEISVLFSKCIARQCQEILSKLTNGSILEVGAGSGIFAADLLLELERMDCLPVSYGILEVSADLRAKQNQWLESQCQHLLNRVYWLDRLPAPDFNGIIFANEVLDAMPTHRFQIDKHTSKERYVTLVNGKLSWLTAPSTTPELTRTVTEISENLSLQDGYESEINLMIPAWIRSLGEILQEGVMLLFDYGYGRREYYHPDRNHGTLMCYYQHHRHSDPFILLGLQDITAHVDFTAVAEAADSVNLTVAGYTTQASFLLACGIIELANDSSFSQLEQYQQNQAIKLLTLPSQMGELIKVMALSKNFDEPMIGFSLFDRRKDL